MSGAPLVTRLDERFERIARSFAEFRVERETFRAYVAAHPAGAAALEAQDDEPLAELYLAAALRARVGAASTEFERRYLEPLGARLSRLGLAAAELDEVKQLTRQKLLVATDDDDPLRVEQYAGQGRLEGLIQVVATREALTLFRQARREVPLPASDLADPASDWDPGLEILKGRARAAFRVAFEAAVRSLELRQRTLLRLHLLGGVTLEQLAKLHGVHRATVVRWLAAAREHVLTHTRSAMASALDVRGPELESVMDAIQSRLDVSVERVLAGDADGDEHDP